MSEEKKTIGCENIVRDEVLDRINGGGGQDSCKHVNRVRTRNNGWKCLDCGAEW